MCRKLLIMLGILFLLSTARAKADDFTYAYCPLGEGYVFLYDSVDGFQVLANLKCGQRLTVVDARDKDRIRVRTADGKEGYVMKSSATAVAPAGQRQPEAPSNGGSQRPQVPAQPQVQPKPEAQAKPEVKPPAQPEPQPEPEAKPQPEPKPALEAQAEREPQPELKLQPEPQPQTSEPEPQSQPILESQPEPQPKPQAQPQPKLQPQPAATAFTPFSTFGYEQNVPRLEAFGGLSYMNAGTSGLTSRQSVMGFEGSVSINVNRWLAGEANFGGYYKTLDIINVATVNYHDYSAMAGPRFNMHKAFFHALVGIDHLAGSTNFYAGTAPHDNALAAAVGGGVQWSVTRQFALRTSADYLMSRFGGLTQNNIRVTMGIVFQVGSINRE
jgi:hypothetical protein